MTRYFFIFLFSIILVSPVFSTSLSNITLPVETTFHRGERIFSIATEKDESYVFFGSESGLIMYNENKLKRIFSETDGLTGEFIKTLVFIDNVLYGSSFSLIGKSCLFSYSKANGLMVWPENKTGIINITSILKNKDTLLLTTFDGEIWDFNPKDKKSKKLYKNKDYNIVGATKFGNNIFLACKYTGIISMEADDKTIINYNSFKEYNEHSSHLINNNITCICADKNGLWVGSQSGGSYFKVAENTWDNFWGKELSDDFVSSIFPDGNHIWFGTGNGVSLLQRSDNKWCTFNINNGLNGKIILSITASDKSIFIASEQGVFKIDKNTIYKKMKN